MTQLSVNTLRRSLLRINKLRSTRYGAIPLTNVITIRQNSTSTEPPRKSADLGGLLIKHAPAPVKPYLRLARVDKNIGTWLLLFPCLWSMSLGDQFHVIPDPYLGACFVIGAIVMRGAGCTVNDIWDRDIDAKVERTRVRPIASGEISVPRAIIFLGAQSLTGLAVLLQFSPATIAMCASSLFLVVAYPLMKRITHWPQFVLGLTFNWGALVGYGAVMGYTDWSVVLPLYCAGIAWTLVYDTIYAHQDKKDDALVGVRSTALLFGENSRLILSLFAAVFLVMMVITGAQAYEIHSFDDIVKRFPYFASVVAATGHLLYQINFVDYSNPQQCFKMFDANKWVGLMVLFGIIATNMLVRRDSNKSPIFEQKKLQNQTFKQEEAKKSMLDRVKQTINLKW